MMVTNTASEDRTGTEERKTDSDSSLILLVVLQAYLDLAEMIVMMDHSRLTHLLGDALALETGGSCFEQI